MGSLNDCTKLSTVELQAILSKNRGPGRSRLTNKKLMCQEIIKLGLLSNTPTREIRELPNDVMREILLASDLKTIFRYCQTSKMNQNICRDEYFWEQKYIRSYGKPLIESPQSWFQVYLTQAQFEEKKEGTIIYAEMNGEFNIFGIIRAMDIIEVQKELVKIYNRHLYQHPLYPIFISLLYKTGLYLDLANENIENINDDVNIITENEMKQRVNRRLPGIDYSNFLSVLNDRLNDDEYPIFFREIEYYLIPGFNLRKAVFAILKVDFEMVHEVLAVIEADDINNLKQKVIDIYNYRIKNLSLYQEIVLTIAANVGEPLYFQSDIVANFDQLDAKINQDYPTLDLDTFWGYVTDSVPFWLIIPTKII